MAPRALPGADLLCVKRLHLPGSVPPWTDSGISLVPGQWITLLAGGRVTWTHRGRPMWAGAKHHLWGRIGPEGQIWNPSQDTTSRRVEGSGRLFLSLLHGFWANERGVLASPESAYEGLGGGIDVTVLVWSAEPTAAVVALARELDHEPLRAEAARLADPVPVPEGWQYLFETGHADIYRADTSEERPTIRVHSENDQGIIRRPVSFPLTDDAELSWRWRVDEFPSDVAEDRVATHDYVSIACEFENGRDLTWFFSSSLPTGHHFGCPVRSWNYREVHWCVRSGVADLGTWCEERRRVLADCEEALGHHPGAIRAIWLICVSSFQHRTARAAFSDIRLKGGGQEIRIL